uniref:Uncharacterized protein n=1 Tax=Hyaloperonospora arabidopsidis (strain Emoy2) TaxID=559515 RepID=M4BV75_HYAAE
MDSKILLPSYDHETSPTAHQSVLATSDRRGKNWSGAEEEQLAKSRLHVSQSALYGTDKK